MGIIKTFYIITEIDIRDADNCPLMKYTNLKAKAPKWMGRMLYNSATELVYSIIKPGDIYIEEHHNKESHIPSRHEISANQFVLERLTCEWFDKGFKTTLKEVCK